MVHIGFNYFLDGRLIMVTRQKRRFAITRKSKFSPFILTYENAQAAEIYALVKNEFLPIRSSSPPAELKIVGSILALVLGLHTLHFCSLQLNLKYLNLK
jgi:hypothetical protein